ncbi:vegetative cell wall protein gp1-like [Miscanthus floridulus]|uniref:vegetative cell wall protein gp1-like n=1 Tax=Miscanthus floridulus TaxID=154761 RepID=UPI0034580EB6
MPARPHLRAAPTPARSPVQPPTARSLPRRPAGRTARAPCPRPRRASSRPFPLPRRPLPTRPVVDRAALTPAGPTPRPCPFPGRALPPASPALAAPCPWPRPDAVRARPRPQLQRPRLCPIPTPLAPTPAPIRQHFPGIVTYASKTEPAYSFDHYVVASDAEYPNKAAWVKAEFWARLEQEMKERQELGAQLEAERSER